MEDAASKMKLPLLNRPPPCLRVCLHGSTHAELPLFVFILRQTTFVACRAFGSVPARILSRHFVSQLEITQWLITSSLSALPVHSSPANSFQGEFIFSAGAVCCQIAGKLKCSPILTLQHQSSSSPLTVKALPSEAKTEQEWHVASCCWFTFLSPIMCGSYRWCGLKPIFGPAPELR